MTPMSATSDGKIYARAKELQPHTASELAAIRDEVKMAETVRTPARKMLALTTPGL
jgi:hypothetical protein